MPITTNNRVTIPKVVMKTMTFEVGDLVGFYEHPDGILIKKLRVVDSD